MALKLRGNQDTKLTISDLDGNFEYLEQLALSGTSSGLVQQAHKVQLGQQEQPAHKEQPVHKEQLVLVV